VGERDRKLRWVWTEGHQPKDNKRSGGMRAAISKEGRCSSLLFPDLSGGSNPTVVTTARGRKRISPEERMIPSPPKLTDAQSIGVYTTRRCPREKERNKKRRSGNRFLLSRKRQSKREGARNFTKNPVRTEEKKGSTGLGCVQSSKPPSREKQQAGPSGEDKEKKGNPPLSARERSI